MRQRRSAVAAGCVVGMVFALGAFGLPTLAAAAGYPPPPAVPTPSPHSTPPKAGATTVVVGTVTSITVSPGKSVFLDGGSVRGSVTVPATSTFSATGGTVHGNIFSSGAISLNGTHVGGAVTIEHVGTGKHASTLAKDRTRRASRSSLRMRTLVTHICGAVIGKNFTYEANALAIEMGGSHRCRASVVHGGLIVESNAAAILVDGNAVSGNIVVRANKGGTLIGNDAGGSCSLSGDKPRVNGRGNRAKKANTCNGAR